MQTSSTSVIERRVLFSATLNTHPFEVGWAREAVYFIQLKGNEATDVSVETQVSPDGIHWLGFGSPVLHRSGEPMSMMSHVGGFGSWLRIVLTPRGACPEMEALVHLTLKG